MAYITRKKVSRSDKIEKWTLAFCWMNLILVLHEGSLLHGNVWALFLATEPCGLC